MKIKSVFYALVSVLLVSTSYGGYEALALPPDTNFGSQNKCTIRDGPQGQKDQYITCCWSEPDLLNPGETINWCQSCVNTVPPSNCNEVFIETSSPTDSATAPSQNDEVLEQPEESSPNDNNNSPNDGILQQPKSPFQGNSPNNPFNRGGVLEQ